MAIELYQERLPDFSHIPQLTRLFYQDAKQAAEETREEDKDLPLLWEGMD